MYTLLITQYTTGSFTAVKGQGQLKALHDQHLLDAIAAATSHSDRHFNYPYLCGLGYFVNSASNQVSIDTVRLKTADTYFIQPTC